MTILLFTFLLLTTPQQRETVVIHELYRLRNEHKADSAEYLFADTVQVYMKYMRNVPRHKITEADRQFWKAHPNNKFEITSPIEVRIENGQSVATFTGKEYLDGKSFVKEKIEIRFDRRYKILSMRGSRVK